MFKLREVLVGATRPYFGIPTEDLGIGSEYDVPYYEGDDFFDRKHRLNVHHPLRSPAPPPERRGEASWRQKMTNGGPTTKPTTTTPCRHVEPHHQLTVEAADVLAVAVAAADDEEADRRATAEEEEKEVKESRLPVVVFIHGGGWKRGDRNFIFDVRTMLSPMVMMVLLMTPPPPLSLSSDAGIQQLWQEHGRVCAPGYPWLDH